MNIVVVLNIVVSLNIGFFQYSCTYLFFCFVFWSLVLATEDVPVHVSVSSDSMKLQSVSWEPQTSDGSTEKGTITGLNEGAKCAPEMEGNIWV